MKQGLSFTKGPKPFRRSEERRQKGATLLVGLIFLLLMTVLGLTTMGVGTLNEKMTSNIRDKNVSVQACESALIAAEDWIEAQTNAPNVTQISDISTDSTAVDVKTYSDSWWSDPANATEVTGIDGVAINPAYFIQELPAVDDTLSAGTENLGTSVRVYQITARGVGKTASGSRAVTYCQSTYARR